MGIHLLFASRGYVGAWPSGKAPVFGIGIPGSNPGAPATALFIFHRAYVCLGIRFEFQGGSFVCVLERRRFRAYLEASYQKVSIGKLGGASFSILASPSSVPDAVLLNVLML